MAESTNNIIYKVQVDTKTGQINIDGLTKGFIQADKAVLKLQKDIAKGTSGATQSMKGLGDATGSATSATMELSRVISDAPYGIRGMANNITQLVSQMGTASIKAGGLGAAIKLMWKQMMGPLGIVFAITAVVSALDYFQGGMKKSTEESKELNDELEKTAKILKQINTVLDTLNVTGDSLKFDWMDSFTAGVEGLDAKGLLRILERDIKGITHAFNKLSKEEQNIQGIESLVQKKKDLIDNLLTEKTIKTELGELDKEYAVYRSLGDSAAKTKLTEEIVRKQKELFAVQKAIIDTEELFKKAEKAKKDGKRVKVIGFDLKELQIGSAKYVKELMKVEEKTKMLLAGTNSSKLQIQRHYHLQRLGEAIGANAELRAAYEKYYDDLIALEDEAEISRNSKADLSFGDRIGRLTPNEIKERQAQILEAKLQTMMEASQAITSFMNAEFQREITIEQNKTNAINNELKERLNNENLSASERKRIQLEISKNDEAMRVKKEKLEKKAFKIQKAANIANALVSTYSGASAAYFNSLANPMNKLLPDGGLVRAKINAGIAAAVGLTNVAMIARQKFQSSSAGAPSAGALGGSGSSGGNDRSFNFNLAGASRENQLANTLQGRFNQPLQAYVVSRDITNQQQLDEEITNSASFG